MKRAAKRTGLERAELLPVSKDSITIAGEPLAYPTTPSPEISSAIVPIAPGATTAWMTHPVPLYVYVLEGTLTVEFAEGTPRTFRAGEAFLQARSKWHRGRNDGERTARFLAVFFGARDVPTVLHPPASEESAPDPDPPRHTRHTRHTRPMRPTHRRGRIPKARPHRRSRVHRRRMPRRRR